MTWSEKLKKFLSFIESSCSPSLHFILNIFMNNPGTIDSNKIKTRNSKVKIKGKIRT